MAHEVIHFENGGFDLSLSINPESEDYTLLLTLDGHAAAFNVQDAMRLLHWIDEHRTTITRMTGRQTVTQPGDPLLDAWYWESEGE